MRIALVLLAMAALGALYYWQQHEKAKPRESPQAVTSQTPISQPTQSPQTSEANWMKRSLDRAHDVARKVQAKAKENQDE
jgi:hypothetical protein